MQNNRGDLSLLHQSRNVCRLPKLAVAADRETVSSHCASNRYIQEIRADLGRVPVLEAAV
jgi:hypothetical protein